MNTAIPKSLNIWVNYLLKKDMVLTDVQLKILYKIAENKEGILLSQLAEELKMDRGNTGKYINTLTSMGIIKEVSRNPKIIQMSKPKYITHLNIIQCPKCQTIMFISQDYKIYKCKNCKKDIFVNDKTKKGMIKEESYKKLISLCKLTNSTELDEMIDKIWENTLVKK